MKRLKNLIIPILCLLALLLFAGEPLREANATTLNEAVETLSTDGSLQGRINQREINIINALINNISFTGAFAKGKESGEEGNTSYEHFLIQYFGRKSVNLGENNWKEVESKILELDNLMQLENKKNLKELSADEREIAVGLTKGIFSACGLSAGFNPSGELISLSDESGSFTLSNGKTNKQHINSGILTLVIMVVGILQVICYILSRKSQIIIKDVKYNGFHKEEYAR